MFQVLEIQSVPLAPPVSLFVLTPEQASGTTQSSVLSFDHWLHTILATCSRFLLVKDCSPNNFYL